MHQKHSLMLAAPFIFAGFLLSGCAKKVDCDNAQVCVKNIGKDTIWYGWNTSVHDKALPPGQKTCQYVGPVHISGTSSQTSIIYFETDGATYAIEVNDCDVEKEIE